MKAEKDGNGKKYSGHEINKSQRPSYSLGLPSSGVATPEAVDKLNNQSNTTPIIYFHTPGEGGCYTRQ